MNTLASGSIPLEDDESKETPKPEVKPDAKPEVKSTSPGGVEETQWEVVATTPGLAPAQIIANRLAAEGIPARAWQEGAGQAFGLTVGLLGTGYVEVPEAFVEEAESILSSSVDEDQVEEDLSEDIE